VDIYIRVAGHMQLLNSSYVLLSFVFLQCFDTVDLATGRASCLLVCWW